MDIQQLKYFLTVVETGTFTAAADKCHVSQPSLSLLIAKLENEAGGSLFDRGRSGARLTARGQSLLPHAREILHEVEAARRDWMALDGFEHGEVVLGCLPTTGTYILPRILRTFRKKFPRLEVRLREESSPLLAETLRRGDVDLALVDEAGTGPGLSWNVLFSEPLLVAVPEAHPLAPRGAIGIEALRDEPLIIMKSGHGFRTIVTDFLETRGILPRVVYESAGIDTVQALVEAGLGLSLVPRMVRKSEGIAYLDILPPTPTRTISLAQREGQGLSPAATALKEMIQDGFASGDFLP